MQGSWFRLNHLKTGHTHILNISRTRTAAIAVAIIVYLTVGLGVRCQAQSLEIHTGDPVPRDVRDMYDRGLQFLAANQDGEGCWPSGHRGAGVAGMGLMCFLASGEDPNYGLYAGNVRRCIRFIIEQQDPETGYFGISMYHHGFAMLGLAEAYGAVDEKTLWGEVSSVQGAPSVSRSNWPCGPQ